MKVFSVFYILFFCMFSSIFAFYPQYQEFINKIPLEGYGSYMRFAEKIDKKQIKTIFEIGSRDALDAIVLSIFFKCHVFAFECNPKAIEVCKSHIGNNPNITLVPLGAWDKSGEIPFYTVPNDRNGVSSFFEFNPKASFYPTIFKYKWIQEKIFVQCTRLDEFLKAKDIDNIDLLCMDVQGAAYQVLSGLGDQLKKVKYIIVELENDPIYSGEILFNDVDKFLIEMGFQRISPISRGLWDDFLYINSNLRK